MKFIGDNTRFGTERVDITEERHADPIVNDSEAFPFGVDGLVPVSTARKKKGGVKTVYAFPFGEGEPPADNQLAHELCAAVEFLNVLISEASDLAGHPFAEIGAVQIGVAERGYCFTRVEEIRSDDAGNTPIHLRVESSDLPNTAHAPSAVLQYDPQGYVRHVLITERDDNGDLFRIVATEDYATGDVLVQRVTQTSGTEDTTTLYPAHWDRDRFDRDEDYDRY